MGVGIVVVESVLLKEEEEEVVAELDANEEAAIVESGVGMAREEEEAVEVVGRRVLEDEEGRVGDDEGLRVDSGWIQCVRYRSRVI